MTQSEKIIELFYTGLTPAEYINEENCKCIVCKGKDGEKQVVEIDGVAAMARIEIEKISLENEGIEICFPVCLKCQRFLEGLISLFDGDESQKALKKMLPHFYL